MHTIKEAYTKVQIGYLCNPRIAPILENNPCLSVLFVYDKNEFRAMRWRSFFSWLEALSSFIGKIKEERFNLAIDFSLGSNYAFFCWLAGIKHRVGYDYNGKGWLLTKKLRWKGFEKKHIVEYYYDILKLIGIEQENRRLELCLDDKDVAWAKEFLLNHGINDFDYSVAILPGSGARWGKSAYLRRWPTEKFASLADKIIMNHKAKIIILGSSSETTLAKLILKNMHCPAVDAVGVTDSLSRFAALLGRMKLVISNGSGPMHLAVAAGVKTLSIFGPVDEKVYGPYPESNEHIVVKEGIGCQPCYRRFKIPACKRNRECLRSLSVDKVYSCARKVLE
jgi:ADP-heptose:LPS heptosyltransferase